MHAPPTVVGVRQGKECGKCTYIVLYVLRVIFLSFTSALIFKEAVSQSLDFFYLSVSWESNRPIHTV